LDLYIIFTPNY